MKKVTLLIDGEERVFHNVESISIADEEPIKSSMDEVAQPPREGEWFEVKPKN